LADRPGFFESTTSEYDRPWAPFGLRLTERKASGFGCLSRPRSKVVPAVKAIANWFIQHIIQFLKSVLFLLFKWSNYRFLVIFIYLWVDVGWCCPLGWVRREGCGFQVLVGLRKPSSVFDLVWVWFCCVCCERVTMRVLWWHKPVHAPV
jgi:hypothetical protein